ncbi:DUF975 family protein [Enterococcus saccharolyticus]|uniref:DUF975 family protein n=1 Tax=Enterococcus saccharolyticus TaxID=41997 RepID=UPI0039E091EE
MKTNAELKMEAKQMLQGRWKESVLMCVIPTLIAILSVIVIAILMIPVLVITQDFPSYVDGSMTSTGDSSGGSGGGFVSGLIGTYFTVAIGWTFLDVFRGRKVMIEPFRDIFRSFRSPYALSVLVVYLLTTIFTTLWSLLLVIPGIIKYYSYSQAYMIYYDTFEETGERPGYLNTITASRRLMDGYKGQLFLLDLSFIGWHLLAIATLGIGYLWLTPYIEATKAAFYNNLPK